MPASSTEQWSGNSTEKGVEGWIAYRTFLVTGAMSDEEARTATPLDGRQIPSIGDSHPLNGLLLCRSLVVQAGKGRHSRMVRAIYNQPPSGSFDPQPDDPLARGWEIETAWSSTGEAAEEDDSDPPIPIVNSAGFPLNGAMQDRHDVGFILSRNEPFFPVAKALKFRDKVNSDPVDIPKIGKVEKDQLLARPMSHDPYHESAKYVRVHYTIYLREEGWFHRLRDESHSGHYMKSASSGGGEVGPTPGPFCSSDGQDLQEPALLNGEGIPLIEKQRWVRDNYGTAHEAVGPPVLLVPKDYIDTASSGARFIKYKKGKRISFADFFK